MKGHAIYCTTAQLWDDISLQFKPLHNLKHR